MQGKAVIGAVLAACIAAPAMARVTEINVAAVEPFAEGAAYGATGAYERVRGTFKGELDPLDARNKVIVNLARAPRNARGLVEYEADFFLLRPADAARGNRKIIYDVTNRGRKLALWFLNDANVKSVAAANSPATVNDAGNGFLLRMGYTLAWSGWDPDAPSRNYGLVMKAVVATDNGARIVRVIRDEFVSGTRSRDDSGGGAAESFHLSYAAASPDQAHARLTVRRGETDARREIPATGWTYVNAREIRLLPAGRKGEPGSLYEFHYPAQDPRVLGVGMAATRDLISFLRYETADAKGAPNPARAGVRGVLGFGRSQSGRFLRDFVKDGFNQDESARKVFDGMLAYTAGAGGVFLNYEFGQPNRTSTQHEDHAFPENEFPFSTALMIDPVTNRAGALMRGDGFDPLWMETNTSTEYWQKGASLLVTDPLGNGDVTLPPNARGYLVAGTQHGGGAWMTSTPGSCVNPRNPHSPTPALRALLIALDEWVSDGKAPPPSMTPQLKTATFTTPDQLKFPAIPGIQVVRRMNAVGVLKDWIKPDLDMSRPYRTFVTQVDADGNEIAGIRLPDIAVPLATYTGWNYYKAPFPEGELCDRDGTYKPFTATPAEREAANDPRRSLAERYVDHAGYVKQVEAAATKLVAARLLLSEDAERLIARAKSDETRKRFAR